MSGLLHKTSLWMTQQFIEMLSKILKKNINNDSDALSVSADIQCCINNK